MSIYFDVFGNSCIKDSIYYKFMQEDFEKTLKLKQKLGKLLKNIRLERGFKSLNIFALENGINRANLSKIENGRVGCSILTAWRISEALGLKLSNVIKMLEDELGEDFTFIDL